MTSRIAQLTIDARDVDAMATFWSQVLGYRMEAGRDGSAKLYPQPGAPPEALTVWVQHSDTPKAHKNRDHPDLTVTAGDAGTEVERLLGLGARRVDVGQTGDEGFEVLADPEGNEFCVLHGPPARPRP
jgi:hypothetical protein